MIEARLNFLINVYAQIEMIKSNLRVFYLLKEILDILKYFLWEKPQSTVLVMSRNEALFLPKVIS